MIFFKTRSCTKLQNLRTKFIRVQGLRLFFWKINSHSSFGTTSSYVKIARLYLWLCRLCSRARVWEGKNFLHTPHMPQYEMYFPETAYGSFCLYDFLESSCWARSARSRLCWKKQQNCFQKI